MEIFNIHLFEFLLIAGLALVVFGPERLPEVGRFMGKQVAKVLAWQQNSPEARMLQDLRQEFEQEILSLRDELVRTRAQLDLSSEVRSLEQETQALLNGKQPGNVQPTAAPNKLETTATPATAADGPALAAEQTGAPPATSPNGVIVQAENEPWVPPHRRNLHDSAHLDFDPPPGAAVEAAPARPPAADPPPVQPASAEVDQDLLQRLQTMIGDLQALTAELQQRGILDAEWQPPSQRHEQESLAR